MVKSLIYSASLTSFLILINFNNSQALSQCHNFAAPSIQRISPSYITSEAPLWDHRTQILYFVDSRDEKIYSYDYNTKQINSITIPGLVTTIIPSRKNPHAFTVGSNRQLFGITWNGKSKEINQKKVLSVVSNKYPNSFLNDGKADVKGNLWIGTSGRLTKPVGLADLNQGILYRFTANNLENPDEVVAPVNVSNGMAFNSRNDKFYYIDSSTRQIAEYDFNVNDGTLSFNRTAFDLANHTELVGTPDGMTIDSDDNLWLALYGGGSIIKISSENGDVLHVIALPTKSVSSATFGGPDLDILFVTTSRYNLTDSETKYYPAAGSVFAITNTGSSGLPVHFQNVFDGI